MDTGISIQTFPAREGGIKEEPAKVIEDVLDWTVVEQAAATARGKPLDLPPNQMGMPLRDTVTAVRAAAAKDAG